MAKRASREESFLHLLLFSRADLDCDSPKSVIEVEDLTVDFGFNWIVR
jgi:hypothetical protein